MAWATASAVRQDKILLHFLPKVQDSTAIRVMHIVI
jgi:hypothetical protein